MSNDYNIFELMYPRKRIEKRIRLIELFAGIGSQAKSIEILNQQGLLPNGFEHHRVIEFDKYCIASYNAIHNTNFATQDITKIHASDLGIVETDKYEYIMTYSFPCQDISGAGLGKGFKKGSGTRSGLLWEVERLIEEMGDNKVQVLLMENVPLLIGKQNIQDFEEWVRFLESKGYTNYLQLLNSKDYGIPQNRNRCFMVSILGDYYYEFPKPMPLKLKLKDMLEKDVDEKYYLSDKMIEYIVANNEKWSGNNNESLINKDVASTINTGEGSRRCDASNYIEDSLEDNFDLKNLPHNKKVKETLEKNDISQANDVSVIDGFNRKIKNDDLAPTLTEGVSFRNQDFLLIKNATEKGYLEAQDGDGIDISSRMETHRGTVQKGMAQTLDCGCNQGVVVKDSQEIELKRGYSCDVKAEQEDVNGVDVIGNYSKSKYCQTSIVGKNGLAPTVTENHGQVTAIVEDDLGCKQVADVSKDAEYMQWHQDGYYDVECRAYNVEKVAPTTTRPREKILLNNLRIRKLTPKECWRLMGFSDEDFDKASAVNSNAQLYKQAGNSIVVNVLVSIFKELL